MKIIVPMAGRGSRLRPHTLTIPKPLIPIAGKPIVQRLVEDIAAVCDEQIEEIGFVIGDFGKEAEDHLLQVAENLGAKGNIYYQEEALGTAHAILCAKDMMEGKTIVAFADTLFRADFKLDDTKDGIIWVQKVDDPKAFGVVKLNDTNVITDFIEKPQTFVSDLAIIGIYYFKDGGYLKDNLQYLIDNDIKDKGEYQITDALERMKSDGTQFTLGQVIEWLDCGNKNATVNTNQRVLEFIKEENNTAKTVQVENSTVIQPCFIGEGVVLKNSVIGPHVSVGVGTLIENSVISNSIIQNNTSIHNFNCTNSMIGNKVIINQSIDSVSIGDYNEL